MNNLRRRVNGGKSKYIVETHYIVLFTLTNSKYYPSSIQTLPITVLTVIDDVQLMSTGTRYSVATTINSALTLVNMPYKVLKIDIYNDGSYTSKSVKTGKANFTYKILDKASYDGTSMFINNDLSYEPKGNGSLVFNFESSTVTGYDINLYPNLVMQGNYYTNSGFGNNLWVRLEYSVSVLDYGTWMYVSDRYLDTNTGALYLAYNKIINVVADINAYKYTVTTKTV